MLKKSRDERTARLSCGGHARRLRRHAGIAAVALQRLHAAGFEIPAGADQPDRPAGRGMKLQASPVKQPSRARRASPSRSRAGLRLDGRYGDDAAAAREALAAARPEVMVVAAYGLILPAWVLELPRWAASTSTFAAAALARAAPIHRAIEAGDAETGITIMQMDAGLDTGDMLLEAREAIRADDSTATLHDRLAALGGRLIVEALELAACGGLHPVKQPAEGVSYAHKIEKAEAAIDWRLPAAVIERRLRAFDPSRRQQRAGGRDDQGLAGHALCRQRPAGRGAVVGEAGVEVACGEGRPAPDRTAARRRQAPARRGLPERATRSRPARFHVVPG